MDVTATRSARATFKYDQETRFNEKGQVQHTHSAKRNAAQVGIDVVDAINPVNNFVAAFKALDDLFKGGGFGGLIAIMIFLPLMGLALLGEIFDIVALPFRVVKDTSDTVYHLAVAAANGRKEGTAQPLLEGESGWWLTEPSFALDEPQGTNGVSVSRKPR